MAVLYTFDDVERIFAVTYAPEQRAALQDIPFSEYVLIACAGTHMLFPGFPLSLLDIRDKHAELFFSKTGDWYTEEEHEFSRAPVPVRWHLLRTTPVPASFSRTWYEQRRLLLPGEEVPSAATVAFATLLHFKATGQRLFKRCYVRTSDVKSNGNRVIVGYFNVDGFLVDSLWDVNSNGFLGLSASRKF